MPRRPKLIACHHTIAGAIDMRDSPVGPHSMPDRINSAARAGYVGIGFNTDDLAHSIDRYGLDAIRNMLIDAHMEYVEFEALVGWFARGDEKRLSDATRSAIFEAAEQLGKESSIRMLVKLGGDVPQSAWSIDWMAEHFRHVCDGAHDVGLKVGLELFPGSNIATLPVGRAIIDAAGADNGGLLLDIWHMTRGGVAYRDIAALPRRYIMGVEINDADALQVGTIMEDTSLRRRLPGEGDFDIPAFLDAIAATGYDGYYGVEIVSDQMRNMPLHEAAERSFTATMAQFAAMQRR